MIGEIIFYDPRRRWGMLSSDDGDYFVHQRFIEYDQMARRIVYQNELVEFTPSPDESAKPGARPIAKGVRPLNRPEESLAPDYWEIGTILSIVKNHGYIARDCDDSIFYRVRDVVTIGLEVGARVVFGIDHDEQGYRAMNIEVLLPEGEQGNQQ